MTLYEVCSLKMIKIKFYFLQYLGDIEDHLNITIQQVNPDFKVPVNEFDGKVVTFFKKFTQFFV